MGVLKTGQDHRSVCVDYESPRSSVGQDLDFRSHGDDDPVFVECERLGPRLIRVHRVHGGIDDDGDPLGVDGDEARLCGCRLWWIPCAGASYEGGGSEGKHPHLTSQVLSEGSPTRSSGCDPSGVPSRTRIGKQEGEVAEVGFEDNVGRRAISAEPDTIVARA